MQYKGSTLALAFVVQELSGQETQQESNQSGNLDAGQPFILDSFLEHRWLFPS